MSSKRYPGRNGSLQRNMEKAERRERSARNRVWDSKKKRIREKAWRTCCAASWARSEYINHCFDEVLK